MVNCNDHEEEINVAIVKRALELGINFFDTAELYHFTRAEPALGRHLRKAGARREDVVITTKLFSHVEENPEGNKMA